MSRCVFQEYFVLAELIRDSDTEWMNCGRSDVGAIHPGLNCSDSRNKCLTIFMVVSYLGRRRNTCNYASITVARTNQMEARQDTESDVR